MPPTLVCASSCSSAALDAVCALIVDEYPSRQSHARGFRTHSPASDATSRLVLLDDDDADAALGCVELRPSCAVRGCEDLRNVLMETVIVSPSFRGRGMGKLLVRAATQWAFTRGADVVSAFCATPLIAFYTHVACGFMYEPPIGKGGDDDLDACVRAFASEDARARYVEARKMF